MPEHSSFRAVHNDLRQLPALTFIGRRCFIMKMSVDWIVFVLDERGLKRWLHTFRKRTV